MVAQVPVASIEAPKKWRKVSKAGVDQIADSFSKDGQLQAIGVRLNPKKEGSYILVWGRHRWEAAEKNGWTMIDAKVLSVDDKHVNAATIAENLFRTGLKTGERMVALKSWNEAYSKAHPEVHGTGHQVANYIATAKAEARKNDEPEPVIPPTFVDHAAEVTGMPRKTVEGYLQAASNLSDEQLSVLADADVPKDVVKKINRLEPEQRDCAVTLVAGGLNAKEAIANATLPANATRVQVGDPNEYRKTEANMTDEEWLETYCGEVLARLKYQAPFKRDAIIYRHTRDPRKTFRSQMKKPLAQGKGEPRGPFYRLLEKLVNVDSPSAWLPCGACGGTGQSKDGDGEKCSFCYGHAYTIKSGEWCYRRA